MIVLFALSLTSILAMAGLLVDGGMAWVNRRQAQSAADTGALAAAIAGTKGTNVTTAALAIAAANGFVPGYTDCGGTPRTDGVVVNRPPLSGPHTGDTNFIEVVTTKPMKTTFAGAVGQGCWMVSARAVASVKSQVAQCSFCSLSTDGILHHLILNNGADLRVDGDIVINGSNMYLGSPAQPQCGGSSTCTAANCAPPLTWTFVQVCGDVIDLEGGGSPATTVTAQTISITGGWEAHGGNIMKADGLPAGCLYHPEPPAYAVHYSGLVANVCLGTAQITDPLNDPTKPLNIKPPPDPNTMSVPVAGANGCPAGATVPTGTFLVPKKLAPPSTIGSITICPGLYFGGFGINGDNNNPFVTMIGGVYFMVGGGFTVSGTAAIDGSAGVMVYNSGGIESFSSSTSPGLDLVPACNVPPPTPLSACKSLAIIGGGNGLSANPGTVAVNATVTYTFTVQGSSGLQPSGTMTFYDGPLAICSKPTTPGVSFRATATCQTNYSLYGNRAITGVFLGDVNYAPIGDTLTEHITAPSASAIMPITINTDATPGSCHTGLWKCGSVTLHAPLSTTYAGVLLFQDRQSGMDLQIWPAASSAPACSGTFMTDGVPPNLLPIPAPCGPLGGLSGTIYANHSTTGSSDTDANVDLNASGLANVQIIATTITINYQQNIRFAFDANSFANGKLHLVE